MVSWRSPSVVFGGAALLVSLVVLPILEVVTGSFDSPLWTFLRFSLLATAFVLLGVIPWFLTAPVRRLRRKCKGENPGALVSIVGTLDDSGVELGVLVADAESITFHTARFALTVIVPWSSVDEVVVVKSETRVAEQVELVTSGQYGVITFVPVRANGTQILGDWRLEGFAAELRSARTRGINALSAPRS